MSIPVKVPPLPRRLSVATINHWYKTVGEIVVRNETLAEVITRAGDVVPIIVNQAGVVEEILFAAGAIVEVNTTIAFLKVGLPNLVWDSENKTVILDTYQTHDQGMTAQTDRALREWLRKYEGKFGNGFASGLAQQPERNLEQGHELGMGEVRSNPYKPQPLLQDKSQFSGVEKNPNATRVPANREAQKSPQMAPHLAPSPQPGMSPSPKPTPR